MAFPNNTSSSPPPATRFSLRPGRSSQPDTFQRTNPSASLTHSKACSPPRSSHSSLIDVESWLETVEEPTASKCRRNTNPVPVWPTLDELEDSTEGIDPSIGKVGTLSVSRDAVYKLSYKSSVNSVCSTSDSRVLLYCQLQKPASRSQRSLQCLFQHIRDFRSDWGYNARMPQILFHQRTDEAAWHCV